MAWHAVNVTTEWRIGGQHLWSYRGIMASESNHLSTYLGLQHSADRPCILQLQRFEQTHDLRTMNVTVPYGILLPKAI